MNKDILSSLLKESGISIVDFYSHGKASECYVRVSFTQNDGFVWETYVPFVNRRAGLFLNDEIELAAYLKSIKPYFQESAMEEWRKREKRKWLQSKADVTKKFFFALLSFKPETKFPKNDNPARRIQDIKDAGYTIATLPHYDGLKSARILLPLPVSSEMGYETFTPQFKARVIKLLKGVNAFEAKKTTP